jgi:hypothetical protein
MKTSRFLFAMIAGGALLHGPSRAESPKPAAARPPAKSQVKDQTDSKRVDGKDDKNHPVATPFVAKKPAAWLVRNFPQRLPGPAPELRQPVPAKSVGVSGNAVAQSKFPGVATLPGRPNSVDPHGVPFVARPRYHGSVPGLLGGMANSTRNPALTGTGMARKP